MADTDYPAEDHSAQILEFSLRSSGTGYQVSRVSQLEGLDRLRRGSDVSWLGQCAIPEDVLLELSQLLDMHPELRAMKVMDQSGCEMALWTGNLPNGYSRGI